MITGFEDLTSELDSYERETLLPVIIAGLKPKIGEKRAVSSTHIISVLKAKGYQINGARLRKVIHEIRVKNLISGLIATSKGYYVAESKEELKKYVQSLRERENSIKLVRLTIEKSLSI